MEPITGEAFEKWAKDHDWLRMSERAAPTGKQYIYLTPAGNVAIAMYDLKGTFIGVGQPVPVPMAPGANPGGRLGFGR
uniref:Uncharacterized protein n=1 Tax=viral metagenome TaxID=1070528 RepID=A0A6M3X4Z9_9ZZZZ